MNMNKILSNNIVVHPKVTILMKKLNGRSLVSIQF